MSEIAKNNIKIYGCGANESKKPSPFLSKLIKGKFGKKALITLSVFATTGLGYIDRANDLSLTYTGTKSHSIYHSGIDNTATSPVDEKIYGRTHPNITHFNMPIHFTSTKINEDGSVERWISSNKKLSLYAKADPHQLDIKNPFTNKNETITVLIEQGHTQEELDFMKNLLKISAELKINYDKIKNGNKSHYGKIIFTTKKSRDDKDTYGYFMPFQGMIQVDKMPIDDKNIMKLINIISHELGHSYSRYINRYITSTQLNEAFARTIGYLAEKEYQKKHPEHKISKGNAAFEIIYKEAKKNNLPSDKMIKALFIGTLQYSSLALQYDSDPSQFIDRKEDLAALEKEFPAYLRDKGRENAPFIKDLDGIDMGYMNVYLDEEKWYEELNNALINYGTYNKGKGEKKETINPVIIEVEDWRTGKKYEIDASKIMNLKESGIMQISDNQENNKNLTALAIARKLNSKLT